MAEAPKLYPHPRGHFQYALAYAGFDDKGRAIEELEKWTSVGPVRIGFTLTAPESAFSARRLSREGSPQKGRVTSAVRVYELTFSVRARLERVSREEFGGGIDCIPSSI